jgi:hypothetical protein
MGRNSTRKKKFLDEFLADPAKNGAEAARKAGWSEATCKQAAWSLLHRDPFIKAELEKRLGVAMAKAEATVEDVVQDVLKLRGEAELVGDRNLRLKCNEFLAKYLGMFIERHEDVGVTALVERLDQARKNVTGLDRTLEHAAAERFLLGTGADTDFEDLPSLPVAAGRHRNESSATPVESPSAVPPAEIPATRRRDEPIPIYHDWVKQLTG